MSPGWTALAAGALVLAGAVLVARVVASRVSPTLLGLLGGGAACSLASVAAHLAGAPGGVPERLWAFGGLVLLPVGLATYPDGRPARGAGWAGVATVAACGLLAVAVPTSYGVTGISAVVSFLLLAGLLWWRLEHAGDRERRAVLWLALGGGVAALLSVLAGFVLPVAPAGAATVVMVAVASTCAVVGLANPDLRDVRATTVTVVVHLATLLVVVTEYAMVLAAAELLSGRPVSNPGALAVLAAVLAAGYHPTATLLRGVVDRLVFGERRPPLETVSRVGEHLSDDPVHALRSLRESLSLPYVALVDGTGATVASSGVATTGVVSQDLRSADPDLGRLLVGLRVGEIALPARDRKVLAVVGPALVQLMHARALRAELQTSRSRVVLAVEDERRRLRRDLHDGLGPRLTGIAYTADAARNTVHEHPERTAALLEGLRADAGEAIAEVRRLVEGLRPPSLDQMGLEEAIRQHARTVIGADGRPLDVRVAGGTLPPLSAAVEVAAYRIVLEAITNAARHSGGRRCDVRLEVRAGQLLVEVRDDGAPSGAWTPGVGMSSMRERAEMLGGTFTGGGGRVGATLPV